MPKDIITPPFLLEKVPDVATWYATVRAKNPNATVKAVVNFVKKNQQISRETYEAFQDNVHENIRLITTAMRITGKDDNYIQEKVKEMWKDYSKTEEEKKKKKHKNKHELDEYLLQQCLTDLKNLGINK